MFYKKPLTECRHLVSMSVAKCELSVRYIEVRSGSVALVEYAGDASEGCNNLERRTIHYENRLGEPFT